MLFVSFFLIYRIYTNNYYVVYSLIYSIYSRCNEILCNAQNFKGNFEKNKGPMLQHSSPTEIGSFAYAQHTQMPSKTFDITEEGEKVVVCLVNDTLGRLISKSRGCGVLRKLK